MISVFLARKSCYWFERVRGISTAAITGKGRTESSDGIFNESARTIFDGNAAERLVKSLALGLKIFSANAVVGLKL